MIISTIFIDRLDMQRVWEMEVVAQNEVENQVETAKLS